MQTRAIIAAVFLLCFSLVAFAQPKAPSDNYCEKFSREQKILSFKNQPDRMEFLDADRVVSRVDQFVPTFSVAMLNISKHHRIVLCSLYIWQGVGKISARPGFAPSLVQATANWFNFATPAIVYAEPNICRPGQESTPEKPCIEEKLPSEIPFCKPGQTSTSQKPCITPEKPDPPIVIKCADGTNPANLSY